MLSNFFTVPDLNVFETTWILSFFRAFMALTDYGRFGIQNIIAIQRHTFTVSVGPLCDREITKKIHFVNFHQHLKANFKPVAAF